MVLRYIQEAPLSAVTAKFKEQSSRRALPQVVSDVISLREKLEDLNLQPLTARLLAVETRLATLGAQACTGHTYVRNTLTHRVHRVACDSGPVLGWTARCSWKFGTTVHFEFVSDVGTSQVCTSCEGLGGRPRKPVPPVPVFESSASDEAAY